MEKLGKLIVGVLTFAPIVLWISAYVLWNNPIEGNFLEFAFLTLPSPYFTIIGAGLSITSTVLLVYFLVILFKIETLGTRSQVLWTVRFLITGLVAMPIFWYFFIWREEEYAHWTEEELEQAD